MNATMGMLSPWTNRVMRLWSSGYIQRQHTSQIIGEDLVGRHSWGVALLCLEFWPDRPQLVKAAIYHDMAELVTGDVPAPVKWLNGGLADGLDQVTDRFDKYFGLKYSLHLEDTIRFKICDYFELCLWALNQKAMGNCLVGHIYQNSFSAVKEKVSRVELHGDEGTERVTRELYGIDHLYRRFSNG